MSNSPLRRILNVGIMRAIGFKANNEQLKYFGNEALGGIAQFTQIEGSKLRVAQEAGLAASYRLDNLIAKVSTLDVNAANAEITRIKVLIEQFETSLGIAAKASEVSAPQYTRMKEIFAELNTIDINSLIVSEVLLLNLLGDING